MDLRRLSIVLFVFSIALIGLVLWSQMGRSDSPAEPQEISTTPSPEPSPTVEAKETPSPQPLPTVEAKETPSPQPSPTVEAKETPSPEPSPTVDAEETPSTTSVDADGSQLAEPGPPTTLEKPSPQTPAETMQLFTNGLALEQFQNIGSLKSQEEYTFLIELSNRGGAINTLRLTDYFATVVDKKRHKDDPETYADAVKENPEKYKGHYLLLNPVGGNDGRRHLPYATGAISIGLAGEPQPLVADLSKVYWRRITPEGESPADAQRLAFAVKVFYGKTPATAKPLVQVVKTYTVSKGDYSVAMSLEVKNLSRERIGVTLDQAGPTGLPREGLRADQRGAAYAHLIATDRKVQSRIKPAKELGERPLNVDVKLGSTDYAEPILWMGHINKFFGSMIYLRPEVAERLEAPAYHAEFFVRPTMESPQERTWLTRVRLGTMDLKPAQSRTANFDVFAGPKQRDLFVNTGNPYYRQLYKDLNYIGTIDFGGCFFTFNWLSLTMIYLLSFFAKYLTFGNYGLAIILLVLLVRLVLHPLTKKSQISMMRMQKIGPQMQKLKEKYADDKDTLNKETMKLYKEQGASPLLGCLPMFLQMPIWVALYTGLNAAIELRHAAFLPVWITDLAAPDALITWTQTLPLIGNTFNLLPVLLTVAMFLQQKFSPQTASAATSDQAKQQQKMMKYMMPGMMMVFFYKAPSGLTLYIMASTFAGVLDQYFVRKHIKKKEAAEAAVQTTVRVPGKAGRTHRPKKPKGPTWVKRG